MSSGLEQIRGELIRCLREGNVTTLAAYEPGKAACYDQPVVAVSLAGGETAAAGFSDYLGERYDQEQSAWVELYGKRLELSACLEAYAPEDMGAMACQKCLEEAWDALCAGRLASGVKLGEMAWEAAGWDVDTRMYRQRSTLRCSAYFIAAVQEELGLLLDFRLKGVAVT